MDFETFEKKYGDASKSPWIGQLGVYIISPKCPTGFHVDKNENCPANRVPRNVKIGKATGQNGFRSRLKSYYTYWPQGLLIHGVLTTPSLDSKFFTYKNHASSRERDLKQVLREKKLLGFGTRNSLEKREWVRATPSTLMSMMLNVAQAKDRLYGCNQSACIEHIIPVSRTRSRSKKIDDDASIGIPGRPRTRTRYMDKVVNNVDHPLRPRVLAQTQTQNDLNKNALNRLKQRKAIIDGSPNSPQKEKNTHNIQSEICRHKGRVLKKYNTYTHYDVTGDGRCYYYAVLKAIGAPLHAGVGAVSNTLDSDKYFNTIATRRKWKRSLQQGKYEDALFVILDSREIRRILFHNQGIRYIVRIHRTTPGYDEIHEYIDDPLNYIRQASTAQVHYITSSALHVSKAVRGSGTASRHDSVGKFKQAFEAGNVITFVYRNIPGLEPHYEIIIPSRLNPPHSPIRTPRTLHEIRNTNTWRDTTPKKVNKTIDSKMKKKREIFDRNAFLHPNHRIVANRMNNAARIYNGQRQSSNDNN